MDPTHVASQGEPPVTRTGASGVGSSLDFPLPVATEASPNGQEARNRAPAGKRVRSRTAEGRERDAEYQRAKRARDRIERRRLAQEDALQRDVEALKHEEEVAKQRAYVAERSPPVATDSPSTVDAIPSQAGPDASGATAPPGPQSVAPTLAPPSRPGWPTDAEIAESAALASMVVTLAGVMGEHLGCPFLSREIEVPVRGADGVRKLVKVDAYAALCEATAPVLAKHKAKVSDTPEAQLALVASAILLPVVTPPLMAFARKRFPGFDQVLKGFTAPAEPAQPAPPATSLQLVPNPTEGVSL